MYFILPVALPDILRKTKKLGCSATVGKKLVISAFKTPSSDIVALEDNNSIFTSV